MVFSATTSRRSLNCSLFLCIVKLGPFSDVVSNRSYTHLPSPNALCVLPPLGTTPLCRLAFAASAPGLPSHPPLCYLRASGWLLFWDYGSHSLTLKGFCPCYATAGGGENPGSCWAFTQGPHAVIRTHPKDSINHWCLQVGTPQGTQAEISLESRCCYMRRNEASEHVPYIIPPLCKVNGEKTENLPVRTVVTANI